MHVKNTRRILCLGPPHCQALRLIKDLTGTEPVAQEDGSVAGLSHELNIKTQYYTADVPIWLDEIADSKAWSEDFVKPEAKEVVNAIAAWLLCYNDDGSTESLERFKSLLETLQTVISQHNDTDGVETEKLAIVFSSPGEVALSHDRFSQYQEHADDHQFELIDYYATGRNEFMEQQGLARVKEVLEATEWTALDTEESDDFGDFDAVANEQDDLHALRQTLLTDEEQPALNARYAVDGSDGVDNLEAMLTKLLSVKEQAADLPLEQRKRMAAKAVRDVMQHTSP